MITIPAILESIRSLKDKSYKLTFETNELTPEELGAMGNSIQNFGYLAFKPDVFKSHELEVINSLKSDYEDTGKTDSQRLRGALYRLWERKPEGYSDPQLHYRFWMNKFITHIKGKIESADNI
jgi:hypothetical protein